MLLSCWQGKEFTDSIRLQKHTAEELCLAQQAKALGTADVRLDEMKTTKASTVKQRVGNKSSGTPYSSNEVSERLLADRFVICAVLSFKLD